MEKRVDRILRAASCRFTSPRQRNLSILLMVAGTDVPEMNPDAILSMLTDQETSMA